MVPEPKSPTKTDADTPQPGKTPGRVGARARKLGGWTLAIVMVLGLAIGGAVLAFVGQRQAAPDWLRTRIEARIEQLLGGMQIEFGDVSLVINQGWRPRLRLRDVVLLDAEGQLVAQLADAEAALAMRPLLRGQLQPKRIVLSGALATLRRDRDGSIALSVGAATAPVDQAAGLPQLIEAWDRLFLIPQLAALTSVEVRALTLRYEDAQKGRAWTLDGGTILLDRDGDQLNLSAGFSLLSGRDYASAIEMSYASRIGDTKAEFGISVQDIAAQDIAVQNIALAWLNVLRAPISGALRGGIEADGTLSPLSATLQIGAGVLQPSDQTRPIPFSGARSYFTYAPDSQMLTFDELSVSSDWGSGVAEGRAWMGELQGGSVSDLTGQFTLTGLSLNPKGVYPEPLELEGVAVDFRLELDPFRLTLGQMHIADTDGSMFVSGTLAAAKDGWQLALDANMDQVSIPRILTLWPEIVVKKPRKWVRKNLLDGTLRDLNFSLRVQPGQNPVMHAGFGFQDASIRFLKTLPPIIGAAGHASLSEGRFVVTATKGQVFADDGGAVDISGTSFIIPDVTIKRAAPGVVRLKGQGSVTAVMSLLNRPPLRVLKDTTLPVDMADGQAQITGTLSLPLKDKVQIDEMQFHFRGTVVDVSSDQLVPGYTLKAPLMQVVGDQTQLVLSGRGQIGPVPVDVSWTRPIGKGVSKASQVRGTVELSQLVVDTFGIGLPKGSVSGLGTGQFTLDLAPGTPPALSLRSDLHGVGLTIAPLGWSKSKDSRGLFELHASLGKTATVEHLELKAAGLSAVGKVTTRPGGGLDRASFSSVNLGGWLNAQVDLVGRGNNVAPEVHILDGTLDLRGAGFGDSSSGQSGPIQVRLARLQVTDSIALHDFTGLFSTTGGLSGPFRGRVNGKTEVTGKLEPHGSRSAVLVESTDAGGVFRSSGLLSQGHGGTFHMTLLPVEATDDYEGSLRVTNTRVKDAPAVAALLNAISVVGLIDEMAGQGILFTAVDAKFRLGPSKVTVYKSSAVGASIGLSMDGYYDVPNGQMNMQGVISPVYLLNAIGSLLTRKGEGVIGFHYTLRGPVASPNVQVNPLSGLAPGILREVFRTSPPPVPTDSNGSPVRPAKPPSGPISKAADDR